MKPIASLILIAFVSILPSCSPTPPLDVNAIIDRSFHAAGCDRMNAAEIHFDFREHSYSVRRERGHFDMRRYTYLREDSVLMDKYHNYGFQRFINDSMVSIPDSMASKYQASVNSVIYFFSLPHGLKDNAVNAILMDTIVIRNQAYYKLKVWFDEDGGGEDHEDEFIYWIDMDDFKLDYLAYSYATNGGGMRFREAINPRLIEGIRVVDYNNYKPEQANATLEQLDSLFIHNQLSLLSQIENDNVTISLIKG